jgi:cytochrome P450
MNEPQPVVTGFDDVRAVLRDRRLSARSFVDDMIAGGLSPTTAAQLTPLFGRDGDDHRRHRALLAAAFTPRSVERLRPVAARVAGRLADDIAGAGGHCEFVTAFAAPLPPEVFAVLFGLPVSDRDRLGGWARAIAAAFMPEPTPVQIIAVENAASELREYVIDLVRQRREVPADDLVTHLLDADIDGQRLDDIDIIAIVTGFVFAGSETTKQQLVELVKVFADHPEAWRRVTADPRLIPGAVEEVLRHRPIVPGLTRVAVEPFDRDGLHLDTGDRLAVSFLDANHDARHFEAPDRFDIARVDSADHLTFGWGPHFCVGAGLARVEMQESLAALVGRFGPPVAAQPEPSSPPAYWPDRLEVRFGTREALPG